MGLDTPNAKRTTHDVLQRSDEWHELRRGILTASEVGQLITPAHLSVASNDKSRALVLQLVAERITGWTEPTYTSDAMMRGNMDEPLARDLYSKTYAPVAECGFVTLETDDYVLGYSPDGLVGDDGLIEVKSREPKAHLATVLANAVPAANMAQIQAGLLVSGREWCEYLSYCGGMPMFRVRVEPDADWFMAIDEAARTFETTAAEMVADYTKAVKGLPTTERVEYSRDVELQL